MFGELKEVKYFKEITRVLQCKVFQRNKMFEESSKSRGVFRNQASIYDGAFYLLFL